jgi:apolipoprotein N-acyltransferase
MEAGTRRTGTEITTRSGGVFWGIVLLVVGTVWLLVSLNVIEANLDIVWPLLILLAGVYLIITKVIR